MAALEWKLLAQTPAAWVIHLIKYAVNKVRCFDCDFRLIQFNSIHLVFYFNSFQIQQNPQAVSSTITSSQADKLIESFSSIDTLSRVMHVIDGFVHSTLSLSFLPSVLACSALSLQEAQLEPLLMELCACGTSNKQKEVAKCKSLLSAFQLLPFQPARIYPGYFNAKVGDLDMDTDLDLDLPLISSNAVLVIDRLIQPRCTPVKCIILRCYRL